MLQVEYDNVLQHTIYIFKQKFDYFQNNVEEMDELFEASFSSVADSGKVLSKCGLCRRYMKYISSRPQRLYCMNCDQTYSLPQVGSIKLYKVRICDRCVDVKIKLAWFCCGNFTNMTCFTRKKLHLYYAHVLLLILM